MKKNTRYCYLCSSKGSVGCDISFHKFPTDQNMSAKWKKICRLRDEDDVHTLLICSNHFSPLDYTTTSARRRLIHNAIPCRKPNGKAHLVQHVNSAETPAISESNCESNNIPEYVEFTEEKPQITIESGEFVHCLNDAATTTTIKVENVPTSVTCNHESNNPPPNLDHAYHRSAEMVGQNSKKLAQIVNDNLSTEEKLRLATEYLKTILKVAENRKKAVRNLRKQNKRLQSKVTSLKATIKFMRKNNCL